MGCGSSQQTEQPAEQRGEQSSDKLVETEQPQRASAKIKSASKVYPTTIRVESAQSKSKLNADSDSALASRNSSAVSSSSQKSADSGVGEPVLELVEHKDEQKKDDLSSLFVNRGPSGKMRSVDESEIIEKLRDEGLITRPKSVASGMSFEIGSDDGHLPPIDAHRRLPPRLQRLEQVSEEKKVVTEEDIKNKLAKAAERRRKKREARANRPPRPSTRASMMDESEFNDSAANEMPVIVKTSHPESETLRPPPIVHFNDDAIAERM